MGVDITSISREQHSHGVHSRPKDFHYLHAPFSVSHPIGFVGRRINTKAVVTTTVKKSVNHSISSSSFTQLNQQFPGEPCLGDLMPIILALLVHAALQSIQVMVTLVTGGGGERNPQNQSPNSQAHRADYFDVVKFICMFGVTVWHLNLDVSPNGLVQQFFGSFFLSGFAFVAGIFGRDAGKVIMSFHAIKACATLLIGLLFVNFVIYRYDPLTGQQMMQVFPGPDDGILGWWVVAILWWRILLTPLFNLLRALRLSSGIACLLSVIACVWALPGKNMVIEWQPVSQDLYTRMIFYAPFYCMGLALEKATLTTILDNATAQRCSALVGAAFLLCFIAQERNWPGSLLASSITQRIGAYPFFGVVATESWTDTCLRIAGSEAVTVTMFVAVRKMCTISECQSGDSWMGTIMGSLLNTLKSWGSNTLNAFYLARFEAKLHVINSIQWHVGTIQIPLLCIQVPVALLWTALCCSNLVELIFGQLLARPAWVMAGVGLLQQQCTHFWKAFKPNF